MMRFDLQSLCSAQSQGKLQFSQGAEILALHSSKIECSRAGNSDCKGILTLSCLGLVCPPPRPPGAITWGVLGGFTSQDA